MASSPLATTSSPAITLSFISQLFSHSPIQFFQSHLTTVFLSFSLHFVCFLSTYHSDQLLQKSLPPIPIIPLCPGTSPPKCHPNPFTPFHRHSPAVASTILSQYLLPPRCKMLNNLLLHFLIRFLALLKSILHRSQTKSFKPWI